MADDRNVKILRGMQRKSKANKLCFECGERGPSYICLNFNTFVCTSCSGILREFSYRVKGISMSTFTDEEMQSIRNGGNAIARKIWLAKYKEKDFPEPTPGQRDRIRKFIMYKYQDRRWCKSSGGKKKAAAAESSSEEDSSSSSDSTDSEEERRRAEAKARKKAAKKAAKKEKKKLKKRKSKTAGDEDSSSSDSDVETGFSAPPPTRNINEIMPNAPRLVVGDAAPKKSAPVDDMFGFDLYSSGPSAPVSRPHMTQPSAPFGQGNGASASAGVHESNDDDDWGDFSSPQAFNPGQPDAFHNSTQPPSAQMESFPSQLQQHQQHLQQPQGQSGPSDGFGASQMASTSSQNTAMGQGATSLDDPFAALSFETTSSTAPSDSASGLQAGTHQYQGGDPHVMQNGIATGSFEAHPGAQQQPFQRQTSNDALGGFQNMQETQSQAPPQYPPFQHQQQYQQHPQQQLPSQQYSNDINTHNDSTSGQMQGPSSSFPNPQHQLYQQHQHQQPQQQPQHQDKSSLEGFQGMQPSYPGTQPQQHQSADGGDFGNFQGSSQTFSNMQQPSSTQQPSVSGTQPQQQQSSDDGGFGDFGDFQGSAQPFSSMQQPSSTQQPSFPNTQPQQKQSSDDGDFGDFGDFQSSSQTFPSMQQPSSSQQSSFSGTQPQQYQQPQPYQQQQHTGANGNSDADFGDFEGSSQSFPVQQPGQGAQLQQQGSFSSGGSAAQDPFGQFQGSRGSQDPFASLSSTSGQQVPQVSNPYAQASQQASQQAPSQEKEEAEGNPFDLF
ncbi:Arf-GAP with GTPase, ANK repeat and PH domain-containing protein 2 [Hondaea fermentalgiana]|uniref:Arf-GAP with GTPase, ANK repeat and PH domain-containing protein 2 n=1 Tax=Hondaea fermentalgiana TaxID=2315210 RepID=A0A2R5G9H9_9STRA|nr:Arf-GAP with GTPase, ANK repeat and PH domain-containing protein 2 [Hondaea fermentalgiana]|eukprot:GBG26418.1 Arf-GAP with GTPase, ANK repeat and PH domain-containing protein 2 [Hondaea fermentalgiana]